MVGLQYCGIGIGFMRAQEGTSAGLSGEVLGRAEGRLLGELKILCNPEIASRGPPKRLHLDRQPRVRLLVLCVQSNTVVVPDASALCHNAETHNRTRPPHTSHMAHKR